MQFQDVVVTDLCSTSYLFYFASKITCYYIPSQYNVGFVEIQFPVLHFTSKGSILHRFPCGVWYLYPTRIRCFRSVNFSRGKRWSLPATLKWLRSWAEKSHFLYILCWSERRWRMGFIFSKTQEHSVPGFVMIPGNRLISLQKPLYLTLK